MANPGVSPSDPEKSASACSTSPSSTTELSSYPTSKPSEGSTADLNGKTLLIAEACRDSDVTALAKLAASPGGLLEDGLRVDAWPLLLGCDSESLTLGNDDAWEGLPCHKDEDQVELDVNRAFVYYPNGQSEADLAVRKKALSSLIRRTLRSHPMLCYFQGYHDIVQVMLLVLGDNRAAGPIERLSLLRIRDFMLPSLRPAEKHLLLLPALLDIADRELCQHIGQTKPYFALGSTLTLYAHDVQDYKDIVRLYDFLLSQEPVIAIYLFAALIISRKEELLEIPSDEPDMLHWKLSKLAQALDLESLIENSLHLFKKFPPEKLPYGAWRQISSFSVLKTSRDLAYGQSLAEGKSLFERHSRQLDREDLRRKVMAQISRNRQPATRIAFGVLVGVMALWLRRTGNDKVFLLTIWKAKEWVFSRL